MINRSLPAHITLNAGSRRGFMLLEVVFAASIIGVSVLMVLNTFSRIRTAVNQVENSILAGIAAEEAVAETDSAMFFDPNARLEDITLSMENKGFVAEMKVSDISGQRKSLLGKLTVNVYRDSSRRETPDFTLATYSKKENKT